jgi:hypothetical protein
MVKRTKYQKKAYESTGSSSDVSANIYDSMILSLAYNELTPKQRDLYMHCKLQLYRVPDKQKPDPTDPPKFYFNKYLWCTKYKLYAGSSDNGFIRDMNALIDKGFIRCVSSGKTTRTKSIYQLSSKWSDYGTSRFEIFPNERTMSKQYKTL